VAVDGEGRSSFSAPEKNGGIFGGAKPPWKGKERTLDQTREGGREKLLSGDVKEKRSLLFSRMGKKGAQRNALTQM